MDTYGLLRGFADSWGMLLMFAAFIAIVVWVFRPGSSKIHDDSANMIFRNEDKPKDDANGN